MSTRKLPLVVGIGEDGRLVPIRRAKRGLQCKCTCPACGARLSAKRGKVNAHHFAHYRVEECAGAVETALHRFGKAVFQHHRELLLPPVRLFGKKQLLHPLRTFTYQLVQEEVALQGLVADLILQGQSQLIIELKVTHAVDPYKQRVYLRAGLPAVEIDVLAIFQELVREGAANDTKELARRIMRFGERDQGWTVHGKWLFHPGQHRAEYSRRLRATLRKVRHRKWRGYHYYETVGCPDPERQRFSGGTHWPKPYARTHQDCVDCPHLVEYVHAFAWVGYKWVPVQLKGVRCGYSSEKAIGVNGLFQEG